MANLKITAQHKAIKLLTRPEGATAAELQVALDRVWAPTQYQLVPIADRLGFDYAWSKEEGEVTRYYFTAKVARRKAA